MRRAAVFDLDGTLADTSADLLSAANRRFEAAGLGTPLIKGRDDLIAFGGGKAMLRRGAELLGLDWDEDRIAQEYFPFLDHYADGLLDETHLYDGVVDCLDVLEGQGWALGVCTNKPEAMARAVLDGLGILDRFGVMIGADTLAERKPHPMPLAAVVDGLGSERAVLIGDTVTDVKTARAYGCPVVLVGFGPEGEGLARLEPDAMFGSFAELPGVLAGMFDIGRAE